MLNIIRENGDLFYSAFFQSDAFTWTHEIFQKIITPRFSEQTRSRKLLKRMFINFFWTWLNVFSWMISTWSNWSWIEKHGLIPQFQILYGFLREAFEVEKRELVHSSIVSIPNGGFTQHEMTGDFAAKSQRNYFATKVYLIFAWTTLTRLLKHQK